MKIERVITADTEELLSIYAPYVKNTAITYEQEVPSVKEFRNRIQKISEKYPYLKAVDNQNRILGYTYANSFEPGCVYNWSVETSIYVKKNVRRNGIGRQLYKVLRQSLKDMGILNMNACIALPCGNDPYLTMDSKYFHEKMGFQPVGIFHKSANKFGRWYNTIWMEKIIGKHTLNQKDVRFGQWEIKK